MADQSIFDSNNQQASPAPTNQPSPSDKLHDLLSQIKNENGEPKYKSVEDALVGLAHAQSFIQTLRTEKSQVEQERDSLKTTAEKVSELEKYVKELTERSASQNTTVPQGLSEEAVARLVENTLTKQQQEKIAKDNLASVVSAVAKEFGDKAEEVFYSKAQEIGLSRAEINALAARTPQAALKLIGVSTSTPSSTTPVRGTVNTTQFEPNQQTYIGRNTRKLEVGATASQLMEETQASRKMVEELAQKGMSINDLTKPSEYFKFFK